MDIISHGLWGGIAFGRKKRSNFWWAFGFGVMPDLFSFGLLTIFTALGLVSGPDWSNGVPSADSVPFFVHRLYDITHSLIIFVVVFVVVWLIRKKPFLPLWAWGLHILMDIPTHSTNFFPTPFLWPFSEFRVNGISWGNPYIFFPNVIILVLVYILFF
ncbi:MAG: metal-dependent hydrolase, partial [Candidatus Magasanikbacteria bacterium]|nr:metal-dependent hydrolase [Candidatus Magasanikbacteria bacterium]